MQLTMECCGAEVRTYMKKVFDIFVGNLITECGEDPITPSSVSTNIRVTVSDTTINLNRSTSEEYKLRVSYPSGENSNDDKIKSFSVIKKIYFNLMLVVYIFNIHFSKKK